MRLHLKEKGLNASTCQALQNVLKLEQDLTDTRVQVAEKFHRYKWEIRVKKPKVFKRALATYQQTHPDTDIFSEDINPRGPLIQYVGYLIGGVMGLTQFILSLFSTNNTVIS